MAKESANLARVDFSEPPTQLGRYELSTEIARSEWGSLWRGRFSQDGEETAVLVRRIPRADGIHQEQMDLVCEAAWLAIELSHPAVVGVTDVVITPDEVGVVSDHAGEQTLAQLLTAHRTSGAGMSQLAALYVALDVLAGLGAAHALWGELGTSAEPFYGSLEPGSILLEQSGAAKLVDLGLAGCLASPTWMDPDSECAQYRAPERRRLAARVDARADIFSVGVLLWEMLSNRRLSPSMLQAPPRAVTGTLPWALGAIVARAIDPDPRERYQSTDEMAQAIRSIAQGSRPPRVRASVPPPAPQSVRPPPSVLPPATGARPKPAVSGIRLVALAPPQDFEIPKAPAVPSIDEAVDEMLAESVANPDAPAPVLESTAPPELPSRRGPAQRYGVVFAVAAAALIALAWFAAHDRSASAAVKPVVAPTVIQTVSPTQNAPQNQTAEKAIEVAPVDEAAPVEPVRQPPKVRKWAWVRPVTPPPASTVKEPYRPSSL
jgi:serine/threonine protein kinase